MTIGIKFIKPIIANVYLTQVPQIIIKKEGYDKISVNNVIIFITELKDHLKNHYKNAKIPIIIQVHMYKKDSYEDMFNIGEQCRKARFTNVKVKIIYQDDANK